MITYTPDPDWSGADTFSYQVCDDQGACDTADVTVTVDPVNDPPVANDDSDVTPEDTPVTVSVLPNDTDIDGDPLTVIDHTAPGHGQVSCDATTCTYTPDPDWTGIDTFTYTISDGNGGTATATVTIEVAGVNDPPVAHDNHATTDEDTPVDIDVLANDNDPDGTLDPASVAITSLPAHGTVSVDPSTGVITYTPDPDWSGDDTFSYQVCDDQGACDTADVTVTVDPVNDAQPPEPTPTPAPHPTPTGLPASDASGAWAILTGGPTGPGGPGMAGGLLAMLALAAAGLAWVVLRRRGTGSDRRR